MPYQEGKIHHTHVAVTPSPIPPVPALPDPCTATGTASSKSHAALANRLLKALRQRADEIHQVDLLGRLLHFFLLDRLRPQPDVLLQRSGEQIRILQHHSEIAAQLQRLQVANVRAIDSDAA